MTSSHTIGQMYVHVLSDCAEIDAQFLSSATPHIVGYMMNWGLFGALVVQVCERLTVTRCLSINVTTQISTILHFQMTELGSNTLSTASHSLKQFKRLSCHTTQSWLLALVSVIRRPLTCSLWLADDPFDKLYRSVFQTLYNHYAHVL